ncbi:MAG: hypothetical protein RIS64_81 [Bacteroidota bacterium]|jgi:hypothetical protein
MRYKRAKILVFQKTSFFDATITLKLYRFRKKVVTLQQTVCRNVCLNGL